jgi:hypothetical protein
MGDSWKVLLPGEDRLYGAGILHGTIRMLKFPRDIFTGAGDKIQPDGEEGRGNGSRQVIIIERPVTLIFHQHIQN